MQGGQSDKVFSEPALKEVSSDPETNGVGRFHNLPLWDGGSTDSGARGWGAPVHPLLGRRWWTGGQQAIAIARGRFVTLCIPVNN